MYECTQMNQGHVIHLWHKRDPNSPPKPESSTRLLLTSTASKNRELNTPPSLQCSLQKQSSTRLLLTKNTELNAPPAHQYCLQKQRAQHDSCSPKTQSSTRLLPSSAASKNGELNAPPPLQCCLQKTELNTTPAHQKHRAQHDSCSPVPHKSIFLVYRRHEKRASEPQPIHTSQKNTTCLDNLSDSQVDRQWDTFTLLLSYHDPGHGEDSQWDTFILLLSYHDPGHGEDRQWDTFILLLSYHDPSHGEEGSEIHSSSYWATMTRVMERTNSEIHSFSYWATMTWAMERTNSEIHPFSHWATMTLAMDRTGSEIHSFSHWATMTRATGEDRQWDIFTLLLSYHDLGYGNDRQWDTFILLLSNLDWLGWCYNL